MLEMNKTSEEGGAFRISIGLAFVGSACRNERQFMNIKIIEPIGQSETAIRSRLRDLLEKGGHHLFIGDTRGMTDAELIKSANDADILLLIRDTRFRKFVAIQSGI
jgi:hypothetical protein